MTQSQPSVHSDAVDGVKVETSAESNGVSTGQIESKAVDDDDEEWHESNEIRCSLTKGAITESIQNNEDPEGEKDSLKA